jgi:hypothetical protein
MVSPMLLGGIRLMPGGLRGDTNSKGNAKSRTIFINEQLNGFLCPLTLSLSCCAFLQALSEHFAFPSTIIRILYIPPMAHLIVLVHSAILKFV